MENGFFNKYQRILTILAPILLVSFTFFVFGPLQLYIANISEFFFTIWDILGICLLVFITSLLIFVGIGLFLRNRIQEWYICLMSGLAFATYFQGNFIITDYNPYKTHTGIKKVYTEKQNREREATTKTRRELL